MEIFAVLKLNVVASHNKLENSLALGAMLHWTFMHNIMDAVLDKFLPLLPKSKICILGIDSFLSPAISISLRASVATLNIMASSSITALCPVSHCLIGT